MSKETIKKTLGRGEDAPSCSVTVDLDKLLDDVGPEVERSLAKGQLRVTLQSVVSSAKWKSSDKKSEDYGVDKATDAEVQKVVTAFVPGEKRRSKSPADKVRDLLKGLTPEERSVALKEAAQQAA